MKQITLDYLGRISIMANPITCFKAYDIRGELNSQLTEEVAYRIGYAFAAELDAKTVVVGSGVFQGSCRLSC